MLLSEGEMSDHAGAAYLVDALPEAHALIADRGYDSDGYRAALEDKGITPCIPPRNTRKVQHAYDRKLYKLRHRVEEYVRPSQGLATRRHPLRSLRPHLHGRHRHRRNRQLLAMMQ